MGKNTAETKKHKDGKIQKKHTTENANHSELNNNMTKEEGFAREGEHMDRESQTKIEHERKEKKLKKRKLKNIVSEDEGLAREGEHMDGESQTETGLERKEEKKRKKRELKNDLNEDKDLAREGEHMDGESQTETGLERKEEKKRKKRELKNDLNEDKGLAREGERIDGESETKTKHERKEKKRKKREFKNNITEDEGLAREGKHMDEESQTKTEHERKEKKKKKKQKRGDNEDSNVDVHETPVKSFVSKENGVQKDLVASAETTKSVKKKMKPRNKDVEVDSANDNKEYDKKAIKQTKKKKEKNDGRCAQTDASDRSKDISSNKTPKKVNFSEHVEVFPSLDDSENGKSQEDGLVRGKRFSKEEDEMVQQAVLDYIDVHALGEEGLNMVLHCKSYPEIKNCWKHIAAALPWRPVQSVYYRAHILFERDDSRTWTPEEIEIVRNHYEKHGSDWRTLGDAIGKHRLHVKDTWRRLNVKNRMRGSWSQEEYQSLFNLVNSDLLLKASEERQSKHGMLRDNISWGAISDKLSTRSNAVCCQKWYQQLTSSMVAEGNWADVDDYRLISALVSLDAACREDVDWDNVLEHRSGDLCLKRWNQMTRHLETNGNMSFLQQVDVLANRYCPDMLEARETFDSKPLV